MSQPEEAGTDGGGKPGHYYSYGIPYLSIGNYPGKLIAIEGTDGVGRSTQITLLRGYADPTTKGKNLVPRPPDDRIGVAPIWEDFGGQSGKAIWATAIEQYFKRAAA